MKTALQPAALFDSSQYHFSQVITVPTGKHVFLAGQASMDEKAELVGEGDIVAQCRQALTNVGLGLEAAGATVADLTILRVYMVDYSPDYIEQLLPEFVKFFDGHPPPASTWLGVQCLALPGLLIEIEAEAVIAA